MDGVPDLLIYWVRDPFQWLSFNVLWGVEHSSSGFDSRYPNNFFGGRPR